MQVALLAGIAAGGPALDRAVAPVVGDRVTWGVTGVVTVKVVVALTVAPVDALIVWDPAADGDGTEKTVFIGPEAGGLKVEDSDVETIVITPNSPLGEGLIGKVAGDSVEVGGGNAKSVFEIVEVC